MISGWKIEYGVLKGRAGPDEYNVHECDSGWTAKRWSPEDEFGVPSSTQRTCEGVVKNSMKEAIEWCEADEKSRWTWINYREEEKKMSDQVSKFPDSLDSQEWAKAYRKNKSVMNRVGPEISTEEWFQVALSRGYLSGVADAESKQAEREASMRRFVAMDAGRAQAQSHEVHRDLNVEAALRAQAPQPPGPQGPSTQRCPACGAPEVDAMTPRTVYACGSSDYDQRPGTFKQKCPAPKSPGPEKARSQAFSLPGLAQVFHEVHEAFEEHKKLPCPKQAFTGWVGVDLQMAAVAAQISNITGVQVGWESLPNLEENPLGEIGYFVAHGPCACPMQPGPQETAAPKTSAPMPTAQPAEPTTLAELNAKVDRILRDLLLKGDRDISRVMLRYDQCYCAEEDIKRRLGDLKSRVNQLKIDLAHGLKLANSRIGVLESKSGGDWSMRLSELEGRVRHLCASTLGLDGPGLKRRMDDLEALASRRTYLIPVLDKRLSDLEAGHQSDRDAMSCIQIGIETRLEKLEARP